MLRVDEPARQQEVLAGKIKLSSRSSRSSCSGWGEVSSGPVLGLPIDGLHLKIVDDSSPDGTGRIADELAEKYNGDGQRRMSVLHRTEKDGLGRAYVAGMSAALAEGAEYVLQMDADGSHPVEGGSLDDEWGKHRVLLSRFAVDLATLDSAGYSFQVELKFKAVRAGHSAVEIPIRFEERTEGVSKMNFATQIESALVPLRLRMRNRRS